MSEEQLKAFLAKAKDDQSIQDKLKAAKSPEEVVGIAKEHGHEFTADKITALSEEELEGAAGGAITEFCLPTYGCDGIWDIAEAYTLKPPALTGVFYCFNGLTNPINQPSIPCTIERSNC